MLDKSAWRNSEGSSFYGPVRNISGKKLPSGTYYSFYSSSDSCYWQAKMEQNSDELFDLPGLPVNFLLNQIETFWNKAEEYKKYGFLQKRGILLYGPPGCGKSSIVSLLRKQVIDRDGVVFVPRDTFSTMVSGISEFRSIEPNRPIMTLVEDLETMLESSNGSNTATNEKQALALYDGESQFNNIVHVATTNKPEILADRFIRRPGRFDIIIGVHAPTRETREAYLKKICNGHLNPEQAEEILNQTEGLSLAYMREIASTYLVLGIPLETTISRLREQAKAKYNNSKTGFTIGFTE